MKFSSYTSIQCFFCFSLYILICNFPKLSTYIPRTKLKFFIADNSTAGSRDVNYHRSYFQLDLKVICSFSYVIQRSAYAF